MLDSELMGAGVGGANLANALQGSLNAAVAAAGSTLATATVLTACNSLVTSGTGGVVIPTWVSTGDTFCIYNATGSSVNVYPSTSSGKINGGSAGAAISVSANKGAKVRLMDNGVNFGAIYS